MTPQDYTRGNESCRLYAYDDSTGKVVPFGGAVYGTLTCGIGHTGPDVHAGQAIDREQAEAWFAADYDVAERAAAAILGEPYWSRLDPIRRAALVDMAFQLGAAGLTRFVRMISAIRRADWQDVHNQCLDSLYARQTWARAGRNAAIFLTGQWPA